MLKHKHIRKYAIFLFLLAFALRFLFALPGLYNPELLMRPDSATYLAPAYSLIENLSYSSNGVPTALRVPLYPCYLALGLLTGGLKACILLDLIPASLAVVFTFLAALHLVRRIRPALSAGLLLAFSPTSIAFAPMFLSDSLFMFLVSLELFFMIRYYKAKRTKDLFFCALCAGFGTLTRPLNLLWFVPGAVLVLLFRGLPLRKRVLHALLLASVSCGLVIPWICRNHAAGSGFRIDAVSADSLKHNASVVESRATGIRAELFRQKWDAFFREEFRKHPETFASEDAKLAFQEKFLASKIRKHPFLYFTGFLNPVLFVPDFPTLLENLHLTKGGKGTWDVIVKDGLFAGIRHYFNGKFHLVFILIPLGFVLLFTYVSACTGLFKAFRKKNMAILYFFAAFVLYYLLVTGPVAYPRFQLPALPYLCVLASYALKVFGKRFLHKQQER